MATHSSTLAWKIPWTEKPGRLQSMGSRRVGHNWATSLYLFNGIRCHDLSFWMLSFKPTFSLSSFTCIKRFFSSSLSAIRVVSSAYLRLLIFLLAILIPACALPSLAFCMMYSAWKLSNQGDDVQPWHIPFPIWNQSVVPCPILTVASWPAYRFLKRHGLVFLPIEEFSTVCCDPQSRALA